MEKMKSFPLFKPDALALALALVAALFNGCAPQTKDVVHGGPDIYDTKADGEKLIADALVVAKRENKHVLAEFGANWCIWCRRMHDVLHNDPEVSPFFKQHYELVMIDVDEVDGKTHNLNLIERYGDPTTNGIPGLVLLDADGKVLRVQDAGEFQHDDHYETAKLLEFLKQWAPKPAGAN